MTKYKIIGVLKDFNYESLHQTVRPLVIHLYNDNTAMDNLFHFCNHQT